MCARANVSHPKSGGRVPFIWTSCKSPVPTSPLFPPFRSRLTKDTDGKPLEAAVFRAVSKIRQEWSHQPLTPSSHTTRVLALALSLATLSIWFFFSRPPPLGLPAVSLTTPPQSGPSDSCPQPTPITPNKHASIWENLLREASSKGYKNTAIEWLSGAIQIACVHS